MINARSGSKCSLLAGTSMCNVRDVALHCGMDHGAVLNLSSAVPAVPVQRSAVCFRCCDNSVTM